VLIATDHDDYDYQMIIQNASLVVDTRNACDDLPGNKENVFKA
jgi:UDP-N-acetyl-D-glucosamine dehydrogenase